MSNNTLAVVDTESGEQVPMPVPAAVDPYAGIASEPVSEEQAKELMAKVDDADLDILPTGEIYLSQIGYRRRLNNTFRPGGWALRPLGKPTMQDKTLMQEWALYVGGRFMASAWGEAEYHENNDRQSYATAAESLKSNALMRCCKDIGIASECWDRHFTEPFKAKYCVKVWREKAKQGKGEYQWRRKDAPKFYDEKGGQAQEREPEKPPVAPKADPVTTKVAPATITKVDERKDAMNQVLGYVITFSDGREGRTTDATLARQAEIYRDNKTPMDPVLERNKRDPNKLVLTEFGAIGQPF